MSPPLATSRAGGSALRPRLDPAIAARFAASAATAEGADLRTEDVAGWLAERARAHRFRVDRVPFAELDGWSFEEGTGNLRHRSGGFFSVEGVRVSKDTGLYREWQQPIICQPEVGILGILVKEFDGVLHCLMQAKMEPGNVNLLQLSPTVQATRSNYRRVHKGASVKYLDFFTDPGRARVLVDSMQSEHGSWFYRKSNRNIIVEALGDVPADDDYRWLTFGQVAELLHRDNVINMDFRTVLACAPLPDADGAALHADAELRSWITEARSRREVRSELLPLDHVDGWKRGERSIDHEAGRYFSVVGVSVEAGNREVTGWSQPLLKPHGLGITAFLTRRFDGVLHVLTHARAEAGLQSPAEFSPTVQSTPSNHAHHPPEDRPPFLDEVLAAEPGRVWYEAVHSEEGGRFLDAESRYLLVHADEGGDPPPDSEYRWVTPAQLTSLVQYGHYVNVEARTLLACLNAAIALGKGTP
ncbi:NDP-hexose 2,3-dehydratase family protein [Streptomyces radicis]|uniref:NDP-hexose 2,3-dehydratase n=1 Tax=Streptomyces radicis TaxID=1750517 RepID=A0A3A9VYM2_9ACTN|nr:NDP-hexose 2,3-dehydratase family protein [Streptomyces radicis]RKN05839.1 NDP-hexose 2,3-dehydratase [Streptomyces radicis]RKN17607.1 NDP-hexose 2,3-dehydratase [Streptomyces radicis]